MEEPKGSATTPAKPSCKNVAGAPRTASAPNHVANTVAVTTYIGNACPAAAKSVAFFTLRDAINPIATEIIQ